MKKLRVAILPGDGIGAEVMHAAVPILDALDIPVTLCYGDIGWLFWQQEGNPIPDRTWDIIHSADTILLGATTSMPERETKLALNANLKHTDKPYQSPIVQLRQALDLYVNVRPCFSPNQTQDFSVTIIRENTEGLYAGYDYYPIPEVLHQLINQDMSNDAMSCSLRVQTERGLRRLYEFAFQYAEKNQLRRVTLADKPNVLRQSAVFSRGVFESIAARYPAIQADILNVDAVAFWLIRRPEEFGVIVAENMFGDILSDVGAAVMGGLGLAPSANIGARASYFEPVHGSGPRMNPQTANPSAMFFSISMMLNHVGFHQAAHCIKHSVLEVIRKRRVVTRDLGGQASTGEMAQAIIDRCVMNQTSWPSSGQTVVDVYNCGEAHNSPAGSNLSEPRPLGSGKFG